MISSGLCKTKGGQRKTFKGEVMEVDISHPPEGPFDINSPYLSKRSILYYEAWWEEFFIPKGRLPNFLKGQAERDGIAEYTISKSRPIGKRKRDDETGADASFDVGQSEEAGARPATKTTKERPSVAQRPAATKTETYRCPHGPKDCRQELLLKQSQPPTKGKRVRTKTKKWGCKAHFVVRYLGDAYTRKYGTEVCGVYYNFTDHGPHPDSTPSKVLETQGSTRDPEASGNSRIGPEYLRQLFDLILSNSPIGVEYLRQLFDHILSKIDTTPGSDDLVALEKCLLDHYVTMLKRKAIESASSVILQGNPSL